MYSVKKIIFFFILVLSAGFQLKAQAPESAGEKVPEEEKKTEKLKLLTYVRVISDAKGAVRADENIVPNFALGKWLRADAGIRFGQRPQHLDSYYHYKLELQTNYFYRTFRLIARMSDNVINYPAPDYRKTNEIFALEFKSPVWHHVQIRGGGGYVFSALQNNRPDMLPTNKGIQSNYPIFRIALRYMGKKGSAEAVYGSYDVFNAYGINSPFLQLGGEYKLSHVCELTAYFRYQYNYNVLTPFNYFSGVGLLFHLIKG